MSEKVNLVPVKFAAMSLETQKEYDDFIKVCEVAGGIRPGDEDYYGIGTCVVLDHVDSNSGVGRIELVGLEYVHKMGADIFTIDEYWKLQGITPEKLKEVLAG